MNWLDDAIQQIIAVSPGRWDKAQAVAHYQQEYPHLGKGGWKQQLVKDLLPFVPAGKSAHPAKSLEKRFDSGSKSGKDARLYTPELKNTKQYEALAKSQGFIKAPPNGYHVHYKGGVLFSKCEPVEFDVDITGKLADELAAHPDRLEDIVMRVYLDEQGEDESSIGTCDLEDGDGENEMTVTANAKKPKERKYKEEGHKYAMPFLKRR